MDCLTIVIEFRVTRIQYIKIAQKLYDAIEAIASLMGK